MRMSPVRIAINAYMSSFRGLSKEVWLLSLVMLINRMGAMVLPFMTMYLTVSLKFTLSQAGFIMGAYGAGSIAGAYVGGLLTDKYNYYSVQLWSLIGSSFLLFLFPVLKHFFAIAACIFIFSFISDMLRPANSVAIAAYSSDTNRVRSFSLMRLSINLGFSIGPAVGGLIAATLGYAWIFIFDGVTCLLAAVLIITHLKYKPVFSNQEENKPTERSLTLSAYNDTSYLLFILMVMLYATLFFQLFTTVPVFMKTEAGYDEITIGLFMALNGLLIVFFEMPLIQKLEKKPNALSFITFGFFLLAISFTLLIIDPKNIYLALGYVLFITFSEMFAMPFMTNFAISRPSAQRQGQYMALYAMAYGMAHIIAPTLSMFIAQYFSFFTLYAGVIVMSLAGCFLFSRMIKAGYW